MSTKWERIAARKRQRKEEKMLFWDDKIWVTCQLCGGRYCPNNYPDRKSRYKVWRGFKVCGYCQYKVIPVIRKLEKNKVLKFRKVKT